MTQPPQGSSREPRRCSLPAADPLMHPPPFQDGERVVIEATYECAGDEGADVRNVVEKEQLDFASAFGPRGQ